MVEGKVKGKSDLIQITVAANDPQKAAGIANAWATAYEQHVNAIYGGVPEYSSVQSEWEDACDEYLTAEEELIDFFAKNRIDDLNRRITAVTTVIDEEVEARSLIIAAYVDAQAQNRLIAFEKEQEGKRALVSSYMDAQNQAPEPGTGGCFR
jgi:hypothetical protein